MFVVFLVKSYGINFCVFDFSMTLVDFMRKSENPKINCFCLGHKITRARPYFSGEHVRHEVAQGGAGHRKGKNLGILRVCCFTAVSF